MGRCLKAGPAEFQLLSQLARRKRASTQGSSAPVRVRAPVWCVRVRAPVRVRLCACVRLCGACACVCLCGSRLCVRLRRVCRAFARMVFVRVHFATVTVKVCCHPTRQSKTAHGNAVPLQKPKSLRKHKMCFKRAAIELIKSQPSINNNAE